jgi:hypothetical protein
MQSDDMARWRDLVGGFILAFGDIELISIRLWRDHVGGPFPHQFKDRTGQVLSALRKFGGQHDQLVGLLEESLRLADRRNTVAHHPMQVQVFEHSKTGQVFFSQAIVSESSGDYIDDAELSELRAATEDLVSRLFFSVGYVDPRERVRK